MEILIVSLVITAVVVAFVIGTYNNLVTLRNRVRNAWSQIDVQLKRRYDLIPNLVELVKDYVEYTPHSVHFYAAVTDLSGRFKRCNAFRLCAAPITRVEASETALTKVGHFDAAEPVLAGEVYTTTVMAVCRSHPTAGVLRIP